MSDSCTHVSKHRLLGSCQITTHTCKRSPLQIFPFVLRPGTLLILVDAEQGTIWSLDLNLAITLQRISIPEIYT